MIDEDRAEKAVEYLRDSAGPYGKLNGHMVKCEKSLSVVKSLEMLKHRDLNEGKKTQGELEAIAYASETYKQAIEDLSNATAEYHTMRALRDAAECTFELWRSQNSTRKQGVNHMNNEGADTRKDSVRQARDTQCDALIMRGLLIAVRVVMTGRR